VVGVVAAVAPVALVDAVSLLVLPLLADALSVAEADLTLLALEAWLDADASVAEADLLALWEADADAPSVQFLVELDWCAALLLSFELCDDVLLAVLVSDSVSVWFAEWLNEAFRLEESEWLLVTSEAAVTSS